MIKAMFSQYGQLKNSPLSGFLSENYRNKNNTNLMVIMARSYLYLLTEDRLIINKLINQQNIDGLTAMHFTLNNCKRTMSIYNNHQLTILRKLLATNANMMLADKFGTRCIEMLINIIMNPNSISTFTDIYQEISDMTFQSLIQKRNSLDLSDALRYYRISEPLLVMLLKTYASEPQNILNEYQRCYYHHYYNGQMDNRYLIDIVQSGFLSLLVNIRKHILIYDIKYHEINNELDLLELALSDIDNIAMVRLLLEYHSKISYISYRKMLDYASTDSIYALGYAELAKKYAPKETYLSLLPKELQQLINRYIHFSPLPINVVRLEDEDYYHNYKDAIDGSYSPITIPLTKERDTPYVQKMGGNISYLNYRDLDFKIITNPTYFEQDLLEQRYSLYAQFIDPTPGRETKFIRIYTTKYSDVEQNDINLLIFVDDIDTMQEPIVSTNLFADREYTGNDREIIGWTYNHELDPSILNHDLDDNGISQLFKIGGYAYKSGEVDCNFFPYQNIQIKHDIYALELDGTKCLIDTT
jgi:hypothetical protein